MDRKLIDYCEKVIRKRLEKYDPVIMAEKYLNDKPELDVENLDEDTGIEGVIKTISTLFVNQGSKARFIFGAMSGHTGINQIKSPDIPMEIQGIYQQFEANCNIFLDEENCWDLYRKDILRGIAYHEWLKDSFNLSEEEIERGFYVKGDIGDYKNLPIDLRIEYPDDGKIYYVYPRSISNGLLSKDSLKKYTALFKLREQEKIKSILNGEYRTPIRNGISGERSSEIEKEIFEYSLYEELVSSLCAEKTEAKDVWFVKNSLSQNLVESFSLVLNISRNMDDNDRKLIGIIGGCIPPSIRVYLLEALRPAYIFIRNVIKSNRDGNKIDDVYRIIFRKLSSVTAEINRIYLKGVWGTAKVLDLAGVSVNDLIRTDEAVVNSVQFNDDLPFIRDYELELFNSNRSECLPSDQKLIAKERKNKQRIAFYVISSLQLHFSESPILDDPDLTYLDEFDLTYKNQVLRYMHSFYSRLGSIVYGGYYKDNNREEKSSNPTFGMVTGTNKSLGLEVEALRGDKSVKSSRKSEEQTE